MELESNLSNIDKSNEQETRIKLLKQVKYQLEEDIRNKNKQLKTTIDKLSDIIWNINSIQNLKQQ